MAIAGLVIGILGVFGAILTVLLLVAVGEGIHDAVTAHNLPPGATANLNDDLGTGVKSVTVYSVSYPVGSGAPAGEEFVAVDVRVCAGPNGSLSGLGTAEFKLNIGDQSVDPDFSSSPKQPALGSDAGLAANACAHGYITYAISSGETPTSVEYLASIPSYSWPATASVSGQ